MAEVTLYDPISPSKGRYLLSPPGRAGRFVYWGYKGGTDDGTSGSVAQACTVVYLCAIPRAMRTGVWLCFVLQVRARGAAAKRKIRYDNSIVELTSLPEDRIRPEETG